MRYVNAILLLRLLNIALLLWLVLQLGKVFEQFMEWRELHLSDIQQDDQQNFEPSPESDVNVDDEQPWLGALPADSLRLEAIRLNELFARPQHKCRDRRVVGGGGSGEHPDSFFVCFDATIKGQNEDEAFENAVSISGNNPKQQHQHQAKIGKYFESVLNVSTWHLLVPERNELVEQIQSADVILQYMPELAEQGQMPRDRITNTLAGQVFALAKLDMDSELLTGAERKMARRIQLLHWILSQLQAKQLLLVFRPGLDHVEQSKAVSPSSAAAKSEKNVDREKAADDDGHEDNIEARHQANVLLRWHRFMFAAFFRWHFALLGARSNGRCGQALQPFDARHCEWRISFVHFDDFWAADDVPAYGVGSPLEEKLRFLHYLLTDPHNKEEMQRNGTHKNPCIVDAVDNNQNAGVPPPICSMKGKQQQQQKEFPFDLLVYFRYRPFGTPDSVAHIERLLSHTKQMALFCPEHFLSEKKFAHHEKLKHFKAGIATHSNQQVAMPFIDDAAAANNDSTSAHALFAGAKYLPLRPLPDLLDAIPVRPYARNALLLDLDGAEWDVLGSSTLCSRAMCDTWLRSFRQISMRIRIWAMEEADNWRRFYLWFLRLEACQFRKVYARRIDDSTVLIVYKRVRIVGGGGDAKNSSEQQ